MLRREVPLVLTFVFGMFFILDFFVPILNVVSQELRQWAIIIIAFAYIPGLLNVVRYHGKRISGRRQDWLYSIVALLGAFYMILWGFLPASLGGSDSGAAFLWGFDHVYVPLQATMFSLLAFFIASAAFRAFRVKTVEASLLAIAAIVIMIGRPTLGSVMWSEFPEFIEWIMNVLQNVGKRGILIGAALGAIATGLKIVLGIERSFLSGD